MSKNRVTKLRMETDTKGAGLVTIYRMNGQQSTYVMLSDGRRGGMVLDCMALLDGDDSWDVPAIDRADLTFTFLAKKGN